MKKHESFLLPNHFVNTELKQKNFDMDTSIALQIPKDGPEDIQGLFPHSMGLWIGNGTLLVPNLPSPMC